MFNFFSEVKEGVKKYTNSGKFNLVNISNEILYVEGHKGITQLASDVITFKVKDGRIIIKGQDLMLVMLSEDTLKISGKIEQIEAI